MATSSTPIIRISSFMLDATGAAFEAELLPALISVGVRKFFMGGVRGAGIGKRPPGKKPRKEAMDRSSFTRIRALLALAVAIAGTATVRAQIVLPPEGAEKRFARSS